MSYCPTCQARCTSARCEECGASRRESYDEPIDLVPDEPRVVVIPNCLCGEAIWRHRGERGPCLKPGCGCRIYRPKEAQR